MRPWTPKELALAASLRRGGLDSARIAARLHGRSVTAVRNDLARRGPPRHRTPEEWEASVRVAHALDMTLAEMGEHLECAPETAARWLRRLGLSQPPHHLRNSWRFARRPDGWPDAGRRRERVEALLAGYAGATSRREVAILDALADGPRDARGLAALLGYRLGPGGCALRRHLARLRRLRLLDRRRLPGRARRWEYYLPAAVLARRHRPDADAV